MDFFSARGRERGIWVNFVYQILYTWIPPIYSIIGDISLLIWKRGWDETH